MSPHYSKTQAQEKITLFFQRSSWTAEELKKIKRLAMSFRIRLGAHKKLFCKKCLLPLKGTIRLSKTHKTVVCIHCKTINKCLYAHSPK